MQEAVQAEDCSNCPGPTMTARQEAREPQIPRAGSEAEAEAEAEKVKKQRQSASRPTNEQSRPAHGVGRRYIIGPCGVYSLFGRRRSRGKRRKKMEI